MKALAALVTPHVLAAAAMVGFSAADLWFYHSLAKDTDLGLLLAAFGSVGISGAFRAGLASTIDVPAAIPVTYITPAAPPTV